jgi:hypothetical protein
MAAAAADGLPIASCSNVRVKTVQVAIRDPAFADSIRDLLLEDDRRQVHLAEMPDVSSKGVIIVDADQFINLPTLTNEQKRLVVMVHKDREDLSMLWDAGVRHVVFYGDSPQTVRMVVVGMELSLAASEVYVS